MKTTILIAGAALALAGCMSRDEQDRRAKDVIEANGFTNVEMTGVEFYACGEDTYCRGFVADAPNGSRVTGAAGSDNAKGWTVRITGVAKVAYSATPAYAAQGAR